MLTSSSVPIRNVAAVPKLTAECKMYKNNQKPV